MSSDKSSLHFIENLIEEDLKTGFSNTDFRFRFPPEPNGYLHIGHAKAICLNFNLGKRYATPVNLRFDDTNPEKENTQFVEAIKTDIRWLGFEWNQECRTSDYFQQLYDWAVLLIKKGKAYIDSQTSEEIAAQKGTPTKAGTASPYRSRSIEENLELFKKMKEGIFAEGTHVLRAKINMSSDNMLMRDPMMYRISSKSHHHTGDSWHIYPLYDWAHGQSDYIEQISHSFCTLEFAMHRELYDWFLDQIIDFKKIRPKQREFARLNLSYTVMSKRKLAQLVEQLVVNDWDDPRMPTLSGLRRRGYTPESIHQFCATVGIAKRENLIDLSLLEFCIREHLNKIASRVMAVLNPLKLVITNYPEDKEEWLDTENNPQEQNVTYRSIPFSRTLYIEKDDFREEANRKFFRLKLGGEVRLKSAYIIQAYKVIKDDAGDITEVHCTYDSLSKSGSGTPESERKVKGTLHWVSQPHAIPSVVHLYDRLFDCIEPDAHPDGFLKIINPNAMQTITAQVEPSLKEAKEGDKFQFQRLGYFCVDKTSQADNLVFNKTVGLKDTWTKKQI